MTISTEDATPERSTESRNWDSSVSRGINSNCDFGLIWICTEEFEFSIHGFLGVIHFQCKLSSRHSDTRDSVILRRPRILGAPRTYTYPSCHYDTLARNTRQCNDTHIVLYCCATRTSIITHILYHICACCAPECPPCVYMSKHTLYYVGAYVYIYIVSYCIGACCVPECAHPVQTWSSNCRYPEFVHTHILLYWRVLRISLV